MLDGNSLNASGESSIAAQLESAGFRAAFLPFTCVARIAEIYDALPENSQNTEFIRGTINHFHSKLPPDIPFNPRSILVAAYPCPEWEMRLNHKGREISLPIPPTYPDFDAPRQRRLRDALETAAKCYQMAETHGISIKLLAVLSGLGKYGRNNICYTDGWGSYCNFAAYYTDIPCEDRDCGVAFMDTCETCGLCEENCPTGAIGSHPVIDASRCLTMLNERSDPMPDWLSPDAHHALIGCMRCQEICPANKQARTWEKGTVELNKAETEALLALPPEELPRELTQKLSDFGMHEWFISLAGRNAKLAVEAMSAKD